MKIEKAIEIIEQRIARPRMEWNAEDFKALNIGIKALKAWKEAQREQRWPSTMRLPGETKE